MKTHLICIFLCAALMVFCPGFSTASVAPTGTSIPIVEDSPGHVFIHNIPAVARQFIGIPVEWGGNPAVTGTADNGYLFFSIYSLAAQKAGFSYPRYLPMKYLLKNTHPVPRKQIRNGDLMVLKDDLAAMVYRVEANGRIHLIYASGKRQRVISFNSDNLVFQVYWMENLKGFYRINADLIDP